MSSPNIFVVPAIFGDDWLLEANNPDRVCGPSPDQLVDHPDFRRCQYDVRLLGELGKSVAQMNRFSDCACGAPFERTMSKPDANRVRIYTYRCTGGCIGINRLPRRVGVKHPLRVFVGLELPARFDPDPPTLPPLREDSP